MILTFKCRLPVAVLVLRQQPAPNQAFCATAKVYLRAVCSRLGSKQLPACLTKFVFQSYALVNCMSFAVRLRSFPRQTSCCPLTHCCVASTETLPFWVFLRRQCFSLLRTRIRSLFFQLCSREQTCFQAKLVLFPESPPASKLRAQFPASALYFLSTPKSQGLSAR